MASARDGDGDGDGESARRRKRKSDEAGERLDLLFRGHTIHAADRASSTREAYHRVSTPMNSATPFVPQSENEARSPAAPPPPSRNAVTRTRRSTG